MVAIFAKIVAWGVRVVGSGMPGIVSPSPRRPLARLDVDDDCLASFQSHQPLGRPMSRLHFRCGQRHHRQQAAPSVAFPANSRYDALRRTGSLCVAVALMVSQGQRIMPWDVALPRASKMAWSSCALH